MTRVVTNKFQKHGENKKYSGVPSKLEYPRPHVSVFNIDGGAAIVSSL